MAGGLSLLVTANYNGVQYKIMGTIGVLLAAYDKGLVQKEDVLACIDVMKKTGRHISELRYKQLMEKRG